MPNYSALGSRRLPHHDYSQPGAYFVTICVAERTCIFGEIYNGEMRLNQNGRVVSEQWSGLPTHYPFISLDEFVIMPNHVHGIIQINDINQPSVGAGFQPAHGADSTKPHHGLPEIIRGFKTYSARYINELQGTKGTPVWQRNFYEHVIRSETSLNAIRKYILENPLKWDEDPENTKFHQRVIRNRLTVFPETSGLKTRAYWIGFTVPVGGWCP